MANRNINLHIRPFLYTTIHLGKSCWWGHRQRRFSPSLVSPPTRMYSSMPFLYLLAILSFSCSPSEEQGTASAKKPKNVLFIISDDMNCNLGTYGHYMVQSPNIDKLASEGMVFEHAFCNFPVCGQSRASLMTGLYPEQSGHLGLRDTLRNHVPDVTTMPQAFMQQGYKVARVGKIFHYNNPNSIGTPGHDDPDSWQYRAYPAGRDILETHKIFSLRPNEFGATLSWLAADGADEEQTDGMVATEAIRLMREYAQEDAPFFLAVGFYRPHTPYVAPKKYFGLYDKAAIKVPEVPEGYLQTLPEPAQWMLQRWKPQNNLPDSLARCAIQAYYASISFVDAQVGRIMQELKAQGLDENTLVVFTSDHGYHMGEHGYYQKTTLYEDGDRVPLIISDPDHEAGRTNSLVEMIDLYRTICELAKVPYPEYVNGKSLIPVLKDPAQEVRQSVVTQTYRNGFTLRTPAFRYCRWGDGGPDMVELYDRQRDPAEMVNLANDPAYVPKIAEMDSLLNLRLMQDTLPPKGLTVYK